MKNKDRLLMYVVRSNDSDCWVWNGQVSNSGMGRLMLPGTDGRMRMESAHRASYATFIGSVPNDKKIARACGNRLCINPDHLTLE
ncbi:MAG: hypothetical protein ACN4GR_03490 [Arenicellales bacterium]